VLSLVFILLAARADCYVIEDEKGHFDITTALNHSTKVHVHEPKVRLDMSKSMDHHQVY